ncbi:MAG: MFS transporter [Acidimicrobiales bacterium]
MAALYVLSFVVAAGNGAIFALLPEIQDHARLPTWSLGLVVGASFGAGLVAQLVLARYADRGHARQMLLAGGLVAAVGYVAVGYGGSLWSVAGGRAVAGLGIGMVYPAGRKIVVARTPDRAGQALGKFLACDVSGFVLGAPIGAGLAALVGVGPAFGVLALVIVGCLPPVLRLSLPVSEASVALARAQRGVLRGLAGRHRLRAGLALGAVTFWAIGVFDTVWARYLTDLGSGTWFIALTLTCLGVPMAALAGFGGRLADRRGPLPVALLSGLAVVPFMVSYGQLRAPVMLIVVTMGHSVLDAISMPAAQATVVSECAEHEVAAGQGLLSATQLCAAGLSALTVAPLYERFGAGVAFGSAGVVMVGMWLVAWHQARSAPPLVRPSAAEASPPSVVS